MSETISFENDWVIVFEEKGVPFSVVQTKEALVRVLTNITKKECTEVEFYIIRVRVYEYGGFCPYHRPDGTEVRAYLLPNLK